MNSSSVEAVEIFAKFAHEAPPVHPEEVEAETNQILQQLEGIECSVSSVHPQFQQKIVNHENKKDNRLYGLHALNNLDIAVNGKGVNSMPSYQVTNSIS